MPWSNELGPSPSRALDVALLGALALCVTVAVWAVRRLVGVAVDLARG